MSDGINTMVAQRQLRAIVERVERVDEEIKALNADKSEIYSEAKGNGFDVKALKEIVRKRRKEPHEREEFDAIVDLYWQAMVQTDPSRTHVREVA